MRVVHSRVQPRNSFSNSPPDVSHAVAASLLLIHLNDVILLHLQGLGRLVVVNASSVEEEAERGDGDSDSLRVGLLELAHLGGLLDAEVDLVRVLADDLQLDVLGIVTHSERRNK